MNMKIILSGGGTVGSVSPLIALANEIKNRQNQTEFLWLATKNGPEIKLIKNYNIEVKEIFSGKLRRYFSLSNFIDPFLILFGFFQALSIILKFKPDIVLSAGGFVSVPIVWAAWILRKPSLIHQQDVRPGLANKLMAPFAKIITVTFKNTLAKFNPRKTVLTGNPYRVDLLSGSKEAGYTFFGFSPALPVILVIGGGTGAASLNNLVLQNISELTSFCQVIHLTGGKSDAAQSRTNYKSYDFLTDKLKDAYAIADLVVSRAGMSVLTELAALKKPAVIIPIPNSHQEENATEFYRNNAAALMEEKKINPKDFAVIIKELLGDRAGLDNLSRNIGKMFPENSASKIVDLIYEAAK